MGKGLEEYFKIFSNSDYNNVDIDSLQKHIDKISVFAENTHTAVSIYDNYINRPVYMSEEYRLFFGEDIDTVHPEDAEKIYRSSVIAMRYFFNGNGNIKDHRLIRKYRARVNNEYLVVVEQLLPLEIDKLGNVWLSLVIVEVSPSQSPPFTFEFKIFNQKTCDIITPVDSLFDGKQILTEREIEILRLIEQGLLSKEISEKLSIRVNTVSKHRQHILEKLNVNSSIEAIKYASAMGVL